VSNSFIAESDSQYFFVFFSDLRQVPDNQEVFIYANSDVSIVVEILEKVEPQELEDAVK